MNFTKDEYVDMIYVSGECDKNSFLASTMYRVKFPDRRAPNEKNFEKVNRRFEDTGSVAYLKKNIINPSVSNYENELNVLLHIQDDAHVSRRLIEQQTGMSKSSVDRISSKYHYQPYHISSHEELHGRDFDNRINYCNIMLAKVNENPNFL